MSAQALTQEEAANFGIDLAEYVVTLHGYRRWLWDEYDHHSHRLLCYMLNHNVKALVVGKYRVKLVPGKPMRLSPSQRRQVRRDFPTACLTPGSLPPRIAVEKVKP